MSTGAHHSRQTSSDRQYLKQTTRRVHLTHILPPTREQQLALIEEARAARLAQERNPSEHQ